MPYAERQFRAGCSTRVAEILRTGQREALSDLFFSENNNVQALNRPKRAHATLSVRITQPQLIRVPIVSAAALRKPVISPWRSCCTDSEIPNIRAQPFQTQCFPKISISRKKIPRLNGWNCQISRKEISRQPDGILKWLECILKDDGKRYRGSRKIQ